MKETVSLKKCIIMTMVTFVVLLALTYVLPQEVPLHFGISGAGPAVNKYVILLLSPVPAILYWTINRKYKD